MDSLLATLGIAPQRRALHSDGCVWKGKGTEDKTPTLLRCSRPCLKEVVPVSKQVSSLMTKRFVWSLPSRRVFSFLWEGAGSKQACSLMTKRFMWSLPSRGCSLPRRERRGTQKVGSLMTKRSARAEGFYPSIEKGFQLPTKGELL